MNINLFLSLATFPALVGLAIGAPLLQKLYTISVESEEMLRGDRLPVLPFPVTRSESSNPEL